MGSKGDPGVGHAPPMTGTILQDPNMVGRPRDYKGSLTAPNGARG